MPQGLETQADEMERALPSQTETDRSQWTCYSDRQLEVRPATEWEKSGVLASQVMGLVNKIVANYLGHDEMQNRTRLVWGSTSPMYQGRPQSLLGRKVILLTPTGLAY